MGIMLAMVFCFFILSTPVGRPIFSFLDKFINKIISFSNAGSDFLFTSFVPEIGYHSALINFAFRALPTIIFFSALISIYTI